MPIRYILPELHRKLAPEFLEELHTHGWIYGYRPESVVNDTFNTLPNVGVKDVSSKQNGREVNENTVRIISSQCPI